MHTEVWTFLGVVFATVGGFVGTYVTIKANRKKAEFDSLTTLAAELTATLKDNKEAYNTITTLERKINALTAQIDRQDAEIKLLKTKINGGNT
ncbi:MAG: hypothetical protein LKF36_05445 [Lactobacillus sp.]|nr:hypothetical protein [Lactobacillus sp.]